MSITIGGIPLDNDMVWSDQYNWVAAVGSSARTIDEGAEVVQSYSIGGGRPMTLQGDANHGWQTQSTLNALWSLAEQPGVSYTLNYHGAEYTVRFVHEAPPPIAFVPVTHVTQPDSGFWYTGTIKLKII
jgi:hypothetical protein